VEFALLLSVPKNRVVCGITLAVLLALLAACAPTGIYHTVKPGQTLYTIARTYDIEESRLARINNVRDPKQLRVNQKIFIPGVTQLRRVPVTAAASAPKPAAVSPAKPRSRRAAISPAQAKSQKTVRRRAPAAKPASASADKPTKGTFIWPARGKLVSNFGSKGQKINKGIEISLPRGSKVVAAASGKVIYSGNAIPGYGNLVILEHSDGYFSVYGFNQKNLVKMNDYVGRGERIALSGAPPSGQSARLHFEIRQGKSAVNPILYLP
jgi:lipoprotein NlpD